MRSARGFAVLAVVIGLLFAVQASTGAEKKKDGKRKEAVHRFSGSGTSTCGRTTKIKPDAAEKLKQVTLKNNGACTINLSVTCSDANNPAAVAINNGTSGTCGPCKEEAWVTEFAIECATGQPGACTFSY